jgi:hypothetical protein
LLADGTGVPLWVASITGAFARVGCGGRAEAFAGWIGGFDEKVGT